MARRTDLNLLQKAALYPIDLATRTGNGLLMGYGPVASGAIGYAGANIKDALGVSNTPAKTFKEYVADSTADIADARDNTPYVGGAFENTAGLASFLLGGGAAKGLGMAAFKGAGPAAAAIAKMSPKLAALLPTTVKGGLGTAAKLAGAAAGYSYLSSGEPTPADFVPSPAADTGASSATTGPNTGSKSPAVAAIEQHALTPEEKAQVAQIQQARSRFVNMWSDKTPAQFRNYMETAQIGAPKPLTPRDQTESLLYQTLIQQRDAAMQQAGNDPAAQAAARAKTLEQIVATRAGAGGIPYLLPDGSQ